MEIPAIPIMNPLAGFMICTCSKVTFVYACTYTGYTMLALVTYFDFYPFLPFSLHVHNYSHTFVCSYDEVTVKGHVINHCNKIFLIK